MANTLPIYRLTAADSSAARLREIGSNLFSIKQDFKITESRDGKVLSDGVRSIELYNASGSIWAADQSQLFNPALKPELPSENQVVAIAERALKEKKLLPELAKPFALGKPVIGGTFTSLRQDGKRQDKRLDIQVAYPVTVGELPVIGGGGDFTITFGNKAEIIGFSGGWRPAKESFEAKVVDRKIVDDQFREMTKGMQIAAMDVSMAYYAAPGFQSQEFLYPVYVYRATAVFGDQKVPLRQITLPATEFGPKVQFPPIEKGRKLSAKPGYTGQEKEKERRSYQNFAATRPWEAGTSWIGMSGGLAGSQANAQGFVNEWAAAGWHIDFNWGDANAFESDWRRNDDTWVDNADFVFYTGHANMNGWVLSNPDDGFLNFTEVGANAETPGDLWGQSDLEWAVIAACGPLQDNVLYPGGGDALARWDGAFDGMHILMGYGGVTYDNTDEGRKLSQYAKSGNSLINAWFRAAKEIQPATNGYSAPDGPNIYVGAMWAGKTGVDPYNDHAWDFGSVSADPTSPTWFAAMWTLC